MKRIILLVIIAFGIYYFMNNNTKNISEALHSTEAKINVSGVVKNNFKLLGKGYYELSELDTNHSILVITSSDLLPKIGEKITPTLSKGDILTINDASFSVYKEISR